jgi:hypothetical protein
MAALEHAGIPARVIDRPLTELEMHAQIDGNRPVIVNLIATDAVLEGHVTVVRGYDALRDSLLIVDTVGSMPEIPGPAYTTVDKPLKYADLVRTTKSMSTGLFQVSEQLALISQAGPQYWSQTIIVAPPGETPTLNPKKIKPFLRWQQGYGSTIAD